ncbi:MAG: hypothetical protein RML45_01695 [Acetobacteraceae bacterium]|nr:hypothetical protein [Acetobacteraceae bacterium]
MNSDGLAVADTQIPTADHGPGMLRYLLMNRLLATCSRVNGGARRDRRAAAGRAAGRW